MALGLRIKCTNKARAVCGLHWEISGVKGHVAAFGEQSQSQRGFSGQSQGHGGIRGLNQGHGGIGGQSQGHGSIRGQSQGHGGIRGLSEGHGSIGGLSQGSKVVKSFDSNHGWKYRLYGNDTPLYNFIDSTTHVWQRIK